MNNPDENESATGLNPYASPATATALPEALFRRDEQGISLEFDVNADDLKKLGLGHVKCHPGWRKTYLAGWFRTVLGIALVGVGFWVMGSTRAAMPAFFAAAVLGVCYPLLYRRRVTRGIKNIKQLGRNLGMIGGRRMHLSPRGVYTHTEGGEFFYYWPALELIAEHQGSIHIYVSANSAMIIPQRAFDSEEQRTGFLNTIRTYQSSGVATVVDE